VKITTPLALLSVVAAGLLNADPIPSLFNTGVDSSGMPLVAGSLDTHYTVVASPGGPTTAVAGSLAPGAWLPADSLSAWISGTGQPDTVGHIDYQTTFTLPSDFTMASISGQFATDNEMFDVYLNGVSLGISQPSDLGFTFWTAFSIPSTSDFVAGLNMLDFVINNDGGPEGLRVEMTGEASTASTVPDNASTVLLLGAAMLVAGLARGRLARIC